MDHLEATFQVDDDPPERVRYPYGSLSVMTFRLVGPNGEVFWDLDNAAPNGFQVVTVRSPRGRYMLTANPPMTGRPF